MYAFMNTIKETEKFDVKADVPFNPNEEVCPYYWEDYELYHSEKFAAAMAEIMREEEDMIAHPEKYKAYDSVKEMGFDSIVETLRKGERLERNRKDHVLHGEYKGYRECHINSDWLLVYRKYEDRLVLFLYRTGTHSDLF
jgi:addiction module RelE/StbE family toxin